MMDGIPEAYQVRLQARYLEACFWAWIRHQGWERASEDSQELVRWLGKGRFERTDLGNAIDMFNRRFTGAKIDSEGISWR